MKTVNEEWFDALIRHQVFLLRVSGSIRNDVVALLNATEKDIAMRVRDALRGNTASSPGRIRRANRLIKQIQAIRTKAWDKAIALWAQAFKELTDDEIRFVSKTLDNLAPVELGLTIPSPGKLHSLVSTNPFEGRVLREWASDLRRSDLRRISDQIRIGLVQGEPSATIARRIVGSAKLQGKNGVTQITRNNAAAITRTAVNHYSNSAREIFFQDNKDLFKEEIFVATLDSRTTPICRANDGKRFPVGEGPMPPLHFACRSLRVAAIGAEAIGTRPVRPFTQKQFLREFTDSRGLPLVSSRSALPRGYKGQFDSFSGRRIRELTGQVPAKVTYQEWLSGQSASFQDDVLGKSRGALFRRGGLPLDKFVDRTGAEIPLSQLASTEKAAWKAAGL